MIRSSLNTQLHFVGIGGIGMSGIAEIVLGLGYRVSGTDLRESDLTRRLSALGARIQLGHAAQHLHLFDTPADVVVISSAVRADNPEVLAARALHIPVIQRAELLAELMRLKVGIAVAGSHGKTTTSSLITTVLKHAGLDPTAIIGGKLAELGSNARLGQSDYLVAEADESDGSFLRLSPALAVVTNIDPEHLDHYGSFDRLISAFVEFINKVPFYGRAVLCIDCPTVAKLLPQVGKRYVTYGLSPVAEYRAEQVQSTGLSTSFVAYRRGACMGPVTLAMPGVHSVVNALAVWATADFLGISFAHTAQALATFAGVGRRFTVRGRLALADGTALLVDDYGHHPTEIRATLAAAKLGFPESRIVVLFQPHRYSRTRDLLDDFARAFADAHLLFVCDIYAAGEPPLPGVTSAALCEAIAGTGQPHVRHVPARRDLAQIVRPLLRHTDLVITLGAGDISATADDLLAGGDRGARSL